MMNLRPYKNSDARMILSWAQEETMFYRWCAGILGDYPLTVEEMNQYYDGLKEDETYWGMTAFDEKGIVGHFTFRYTDYTRQTIRLGFVTVDHSRRGLGLGKELMGLAIKYAVFFLHVKRISLGVFADNVAARRCYEAVGFQPFEGGKTTQFQICDTQWECVEMEYIVERHCEREKTVCLPDKNE